MSNIVPFPRPMTPEHPLWLAFRQVLAKALEEAGGCDNQLTQARRVLEVLDVDVESSLTFFEEHGGFCDCEVLMNVWASWKHSKP